jgi:RHS repeat-associated protein
MKRENSAKGIGADMNQAAARGVPVMHRRVVRSMAALAALCLISLMHATPAHAANGQCVWEGGLGKNGGFPYCAAEDCLGSGGTAMCSAGIGSGASGNGTGPDKWTYSACEEVGPSIPRDARWCATAGGTWTGPTTGCTGLPAGFIGYSGFTADNVDVLVSTADAYVNKANCSDTGFGSTISSYQCWSGAPVMKLGIDIRDLRQRRYLGSSSACDGTIFTFLKLRDAKCPAGYRFRHAVSGDECWAPTDSCGVGNPCSPLTGAKSQPELDYAGNLAGGLEFRRYYRSTAYFRPYRMTTGIDTTDHVLPRDMWRHNYDRRFYVVANNAQVMAVIQRPDGAVQAFDNSGQQVGNIGGGGARLQFNTGAGYDLTLANSDVEHYNLSGQLTSIQTRSGLITTLTYDGTGNLVSVADAFGHTLTLAYVPSSTFADVSLLTDVTLPDGGHIQYGYDDWNRLISVTYPDSTTRGYHYDDANNGWVLTSIDDESGQQFASYVYDSLGRMTSESHAGGAQPYSFAYNAGGNGATITDPTGTSTQWVYNSSGGAYRLTSHSQQCIDCGNINAQTFDAQGNPLSRTDFNGNQTLLTFDPLRNLETWRTEAAGSPQARVITTEWHPTFRLPTQVDESGRRTTFTYDAQGNVLTRSVVDLANNDTQTWTYTYNSVGQLLTADGPRTDVSDITTYTYNACTSGGSCGQLATVTDAAGNVTSYLTYDSDGRPLTISDPNGTVTTLVYDARKRVTSRSVGTEVTAFEYWPTGLLKKITLPDGSYFSYTYDAAHRLVGVADSEGNRIAYTLDAAGHRTQEDVYDSSNMLSSTHRWVFDAAGRVKQDIGALNQTLTNDYDAAGNLVGTTDPLGRVTSMAYDALNRVAQVSDPIGGVTQFAYDARDNVLGVTDPRSLQTSYSYDGFGNPVTLNSPDTGATDYARDSAGNLATATDARGVEASYTYDALGRVTEVDYADQTLLYTYDTGTNAKGRLSGFSDGSGSTSYAYDSQGRLTGKTQTVGNVAKTVGYGYNAAGQLANLTTPSGQIISYTYSNNRVSGISINGAPLLTQVLYAPFGSTRGWQWGNGTLTAREYDTDGRITTIESAGLSTYSYNPDGSIQSRTDDSPSPSSASSDSLDISVPSSSNRISSVLATPSNISRAYSYDAAGNTTSDGVNTFNYNNAGRLVSSGSGSSLTTYAYNASGQRVKKASSTGVNYYIYDEGGHLLGVYDTTGNLIEEIVWLSDVPVATIRTSPTGGIGYFYIHTDHLNTPMRLTRVEDNEVMWRWDHDPYGAGATEDDADGNGAFVFFNMRFPGQYYDVETSLHYNYFREYDPAVGGYVESDPIGLGAGSFSTYAYVGGDPLGSIDPLGLQAAEAWPNSPSPASPPRGPGRVIPFPRTPPSPGAGAGEGLGLLGRCAGVVALAFTPNPNAGGECSAGLPPPESNCPQSDDLCNYWLSEARRIFNKLTQIKIPQYMRGTRHGAGDGGHYNSILQQLINLQRALNMVRMYCKELPPDFERMSQIANQIFSPRH